MANYEEVKTGEELRKDDRDINPSFSLDIDDRDLAMIIDRRIKASEDFYKDVLKLDKRRKRNEEFYLGKQVDETQLEDWQLSYIDNLIWEDLETRSASASNTIPDVVVIPPNDDLVSTEKSKKIEKSLEIRIQNENTRRLVKDIVRDLHIHLIGVIKVRWDENLGEHGDYIFEKVNPKKIGMDHKATIPYDGYSSDNMSIIYEWIEEPVAQVVAKFPDKKDDILKKRKIIMGTTSQMAQDMKYLEVHFTWYDKDGKIQEGVCWKDGKTILDKYKTPYYDYEGIQQATNEVVNGKAKVKTVYQNYFEKPRKPYIFVTYNNLGNSPIDDTSALEQSIPLQKNVNKRGRQITEISDNAVPKKVFAGNYITKAEARKISPDPAESVWLEDCDDITKAFGTIPAASPSAILFNDLISNRTEIDAKFNTHGTRGSEQGKKQSAASKQQDREGDIQMNDDLVQTSIVRMITEMAGWAVQMMRVMYTDPHEMRSVDLNGDLTNLIISQDSIDQGLGIQVRSSTVDRIRKRQEAMSLAQSKSIDPMTMFEDMDVPNPKERTARLLAFQKGQKDDFQSYEKAVGVNQDQSGESDLPGPGRDKAIEDLTLLKAGKDVEFKGVPTEEYVKAFMDYVKDSDLENQPDDIQKKFQDYIQKLKMAMAQYVMAQQAQGQAQGQAQAPQPQVPQGPQLGQPSQQQPGL
jgi:hypothetical protein